MPVSLQSLVQQVSSPSFLGLEGPSTSASLACFCRPRQPLGTTSRYPVGPLRLNHPSQPFAQGYNTSGGARFSSRAPRYRLSSSYQVLEKQPSRHLLPRRFPHRSPLFARSNATPAQNVSRGRVMATAVPPRHNASSVEAASSYAFKGPSAWGLPSMSVPGQQSSKGVGGGLSDEAKSLQSEFWRQQQMASLENAAMSQDGREDLWGLDGEAIEVESSHTSDDHLLGQEHHRQSLSTSTDVAIQAPERKPTAFTNQELGQGAEVAEAAGRVNGTPLLGVNGFEMTGVARVLEGLLGGPEAEEGRTQEEGEKTDRYVELESAQQIQEHQEQKEREDEALILAQGNVDFEDEDDYTLDGALDEDIGALSFFESEQLSEWEGAGPSAKGGDFMEQEDSEGCQVEEEGQEDEEHWGFGHNDVDYLSDHEMETPGRNGVLDSKPVHSLCQEPFPIGLVDTKDCGYDTTLFEFGPSLDDDMSEVEEGLQEATSRAAKRRKAQEAWEASESTGFVLVNGIPELEEDDLDGSGLERLSYPSEGGLSSSEKAGKVEAPQKQLLLQVGVASLPHPLKASRGGEDAYLVEGNWLGVADGISAWAEQGINSGLYSRELLWNCVDVVRTSWELLGVCPKPGAVIEESHSRTDLRGSCTVTLAVVEGQTLRVANIGDSGFILLRVGDSVLQSERMVHGLNDPYQIGCNFGDDPSCAKAYESELQHGDVILLATDGLFDNIHREEIVRELRVASIEGRDPELVAKRLAGLAQKVGETEKGDTPYAEWSRAEGQPHEGGKREDVTVIVAYVQDPEVM